MHCKSVKNMCFGSSQSIWTIDLILKEATSCNFYSIPYKLCSFLFSYLWRNFNNVLEEFPNSEINIVLAVKGVYCRGYCFYFSLNFQPQNGSKSIPWLPLHFHWIPIRGREFNEFSHRLSLFFWKVTPSVMYFQLEIHEEEIRA